MSRPTKTVDATPTSVEPPEIITVSIFSRPQGEIEVGLKESAPTMLRQIVVMGARFKLRYHLRAVLS
jgi:hypothetical protein